MGMFINEAALDERQEKQFLQVVNESYFGRTPGITRCFNAFCDFRNKYINDKLNINVLSLKNLDTDHDKDLHRLCNEFERQFGFCSFSFIIKNNLVANAGTYPVVFRNDLLNGRTKPKDFIYVDKEGYHYKKDLQMNIIMIVNTGLLFDKKYTNEEIFGVILHEIGHNFQQYLNLDMFSTGLYLKAFYIFALIADLYNGLMRLDIGQVTDTIKTSILIGDKGHRAIGKLYNKITSNENMANIYSYINYAKGILSVPDAVRMIAMTPLIPMYAAISGIFTIIQKVTFPILLPVALYDYKGEKMADAFASYYGFGNDLISGLNKIDGYGPGAEFVQKVPVVGHLYALSLIPSDLLRNIGDEHPAEAIRARSVIQSLKTDLNDPSLSPKLRKELEKEIKETEKYMDDYYTKAATIKNPKFFRELVSKCMYKNGDSKSKFVDIFGDREENVIKTTNSFDTNDII